MRKKNILYGLLVWVALLVFPLAASAVTVSPPVKEIDAKPGDVVTDVIKMYNESNGPSNLTSVIQSFSASESEGGVPAFVPVGQSSDLATWIKLDESNITLSPGEKKDVSFTINIPADAKAGGYYAGILWSSAASVTDGDEVGLIAETGTLILLKVNGAMNEEGSILSFAADKSFYNYLPVNFSIRFEDEGDIHLKPTGMIEIRNCFGGKVASIPVNEGLGNVLPNSVRKFNAVWQKSEVSQGASEWQKEMQNFAWGKYTANLILDYGSGGRRATASLVFWVFPWRVNVLCLALLVIVIFSAVAGARRYKRAATRK